jgi:hypothetical protein
VQIGGLGGERNQPPEPVEKTNVPGGRQQRLVIVLAVKVHQTVSERLEDTQGDRAIVDIAPACAIHPDFPAEDDDIVLFRDGQIIIFFTGNIPGKDGGHGQRISSGTNHLRRGARPEDQLERINDDGLAGPGFPGDDGETGRKRYGKLVDNGEITDGKGFKHFSS